MALELYTKNVDQLTTFEKIVKDGKMARDEHQLEWAKTLIKSIAQETVDNKLGDLSQVENLTAVILKRIAAIDKTLSDFSNEVLHHKDFQSLEASWRGLHQFMENSRVSDKLEVRAISVTKQELLKDFENAVEVDQSSMFKKIYEEEYGSLGGSPFSMLVGDFYFDKTPKDIAILRGIASVAAAAHAPFVSGAASRLFGIDSFLELPIPQDLKAILNSGEYSKWNAFRSEDDSKYISLALPHVLQRERYVAGLLETEEFSFEEEIVGENHNHYLWGNAAYAMAGNVTRAYNEFGWCAAIRGVEGGGMVKNLPSFTYTLANGESVLKCPTEVAITDRREKELSDLGFLALCHKKNSNSSVFFDCPTLAKTKKYVSNDANANSYAAVQFNYLLAVSRIAHYFKVMMRDRVGSHMSASQCQTELTQWLSQYILADDNAGHYAKSLRPLRDARIEVVELSGKPGCYKAICYIRPHFQFNELTISMRLVASLPAAKG